MSVKRKLETHIRGFGGGLSEVVQAEEKAAKLRAIKSLFELDSTVFSVMLLRKAKPPPPVKVEKSVETDVRMRDGIVCKICLRDSSEV